MTERQIDEDGPSWGVIAFAGICGLCCVALAGLTGGAAVVGGTAAGVSAARGGVSGLAGLLVTGLATALPRSWSASSSAIGHVRRERGL